MSSVGLLIGAFVVGVVAVLAAEAAVVYLLIRRIISKSKAMEAAVHSLPENISGAADLVPSDSNICKQGIIWVLEPEKVPMVPVPGELNRKQEFVEVSPVRRSATIRGKYLLFSEPDGSRTTLMLKGCKVAAVSSMSIPTKKWDKRYPIKIESNNVLYSGSKTLYIYLETCWEKESWCKALFVASCDQQEKVDWLLKLREDFVHYLRSLTEGYPSLVKPSGYQFAMLDRSSRPDPPSKVSILWKKLAGKAPKNFGERKTASVLMEDNSVSSKSVDSGSTTLVSSISDANDANIVSDEGTLCWNLLLSRLFFDFKNNVDIKNAIKARIQRTLSNMRTPSYIGAMTCTDIDSGHLPPHIRGMKAVPTDMNDTWALEMDVEYVGDMVLYVEVRVDMQDKDLQSGTIDPNTELSAAAEAKTDLLLGFERVGEELKFSDGAIDSAEMKNEGNHKLDNVQPEKLWSCGGVKLRYKTTEVVLDRHLNTLEGYKSFKSSDPPAAAGSRWKSIINSVAKQVSQVPFMLAIRVASLRGTMQIRIKPPPSDQLWYGFTSMPDIDLQLESFVGEQKITSRHISLYLVNRFKAAIRENLVFPNCEYLLVPWMLAEKEDWVPKSVAPFIWLNRDVPPEIKPTNESNASNRSIDPNKGKSDDAQESRATVKQNTDTDHLNRTTSNSSDIDGSLCSEGNEPLDESKAPLLLKDTSPEHLLHTARYVSLRDDDDDNKPKKAGRRARMIDLGKKMGEKLEEKRRHLEEKRKNIVDKMRGPS